MMCRHVAVVTSVDHSGRDEGFDLWHVTLVLRGQYLRTSHHITGFSSLTRCLQREDHRTKGHSDRPSQRVVTFPELVQVG